MDMCYIEYRNRIAGCGGYISLYHEAIIRSPSINDETYLHNMYCTWFIYTLDEVNNTDNAMLIRSIVIDHANRIEIHTILLREHRSIERRMSLRLRRSI